jgi:Holliday junction resolvase RusA-like endonuclease
MRIEICLDRIEPISLNNSTKITTRGGFAKKYKTDKYKQLESSMAIALRKYKNDINKFNNKYNSGKYYLVAEYKFYYPILLKSGEAINKKSKDVSNLIKVVEDILFKQLLADDSEVISVTATKIHSKDIRTEIILELKDLRHVL